MIRDMAIATAISGIAFAAFCVWLAVRTINRRERWAKWTLAAVVAVPVLYVLSFGPACWISSRANSGSSVVSAVYRPLTWGASRNNHVDDALSWYSEIGAARDWKWDGGTWTEYRWILSPKARAINRDLGID